MREIWWFEKVNVSLHRQLVIRGGGNTINSAKRIMTMNYYVSEDFKELRMSFATHLIKRFDSHKDAEKYLKIWGEKWLSDGFNVQYVEAGDEIWGVRALDCNFVSKHSMNIFASPIFMSGGYEGL